MSAHAEKRVHVLQINVARASARMHSFLNEPIYDNVSIFVMQDIWWGRIGSDKSDSVGDLDVYGIAHNGAYDLFLPFHTQSLKGPSVAIYMRKGLNFLHGNVSDHIPPTLDSFAVDFDVYGSTFVISNIYLHGPVEHKRTTLETLIEHPINPHVPAVYVGDFNLHHEMWALDNGVTPSQTGDAADLAAWIIDNDMLVVNTDNLATRRGSTGQADSCIDLTIANGLVTGGGLITDWDADFACSIGSDHAAISFYIHASADTVFEPPETQYRYSIDSAFSEEWTAAFRTAIADVPPPQAYLTHNDCEMGSRAILEAMSLATSRTMKRVKVNRKGRRAAWWTPLCSEIVHELSNNPFADRTQETLRLRSAIRSARRSHAQKVCEEVIGSDVFRLTSWGSGSRPQRVPPLQFEDRLVTDPADQAKALRCAFFPTAPPDVAVNAPLGIRLYETHTHVPITEHEIGVALSASSNKSAPGAFGSNYRVLKWVFAANAEYLVDLYNGCLSLGFHPQCLRHAIVAVIPKARKPDMSVPKAYRPISLLETLSKCLEKVITARLLYEIGANSLIPYTQFGGRDNSSCTDAGLSLLHDVRTAWRAGKHASLLTLDIKGYFDHVHHDRLIYTLRRLGFSHPVCGWLASYLSSCTASIRVDSIVTAPAPLANVGIPQGSPLSPVLSSLYSLPVLLCLDHHPHVSIRTYVDDFTILAVAGSQETAVTDLEEAAQEADDCLRQLGLSFDLDKCELLHLARTSGNMVHNASVTLRTRSHAVHVIYGQPVIRWLGFFIDRRLNFKDHVSRMKRKALSVLGRLRILANTVRGISTSHGRLLYQACVLPILTYGSTLWFTGRNQKGLVQVLSVAQNKALVWILGAFRTSPIPAMEHLASIQPIPILLARLNRSAADRLNRLPPRSEVAGRLGPAWPDHDRSLRHPKPPSARERKTVNAPKLTQLLHLASLTHPHTEKVRPYLEAPWGLPHPFGNRISTLYPSSSLVTSSDAQARKQYVAVAREHISALNLVQDALLCYTDGSLRHSVGGRKVGSAYLIERKGREVSTGMRGLGPRSEVFDAEMLALALAADNARTIVDDPESPHTSHVRFLSDNLAAVSSIVSLGTHPSQYASLLFREAVDDLLKRHPNLTVCIQWVPGHKGIRGNERADALAERATRLHPAPLYDRTLTWSATNSTTLAQEEWNEHWDQARRSGHVRSTLRRYPSRKYTRVSKSQSGPEPPRAETSRLHQFILGHAHVGEYYRRFNIPEDVACPCGQADLQTLRHVLADCPIHTRAREQLYTVSRSLNFSVLFGTRKGLRAMVTFFSDSSALTCC